MERTPLLSIALLAVAWLSAACGPVAPPSLPPDSNDPVATVVDPTQEPDEGLGSGRAGGGESASATEQTLAVLPGSLDVNEAGLQVGYTVDGYPFIGDPGAPVVMEEFSDYQCPFCARFYAETLPSLLGEQVRAGEVVLIFRDFPLTIHPQAVPAANAARCAGEYGAGAYWAMHDLLFAGLADWSNAGYAPVFSGYATEIGLDVAAFDACVAEGRYDDAVQADMDEGTRRAVSSTPTFFLNDQALVGAQPLASFQSAIAVVANGDSIEVAQQPAPAAPQAAPTPASLQPEFAAALGDPEAPVTIVEFTDYQCPYCLRHAVETMPRIVESLIATGRVYYVIKDLPLESIHPQARLAHNAARCAGDQGAYWEMHDALFAEQDAWAGQVDAVAQAAMVDLASDLGLDRGAFAGCLDNRQFDSAVQANLQEAARLGVGGTPFFFVDGYPLNGARPFEHFEFAVGLAEEGRLAEAYAPSQPAEPTAPAGPVDVPVAGGYAFGDPNAPVVMVEYTDYQCPFCKRYHDETFTQIVANFVDQGLVYYVIKDFPLNSIHPQAALAGAAAWCADEQDAYLAMADRLFATQGQWGNSQAADAFTQYAAELELDEVAFRSCLDSGRYDGLVAENLSEGIGFGVTGTPAFFLNGNLIAGAYPYDAFRQGLEQLLSGR